MIRITAFLIIVLLTVSCVNVHQSGTLAKSSTSDVVLSTTAVVDSSDKYYTVIEYTIENKSAEWLDIRTDGLLVNGVETEILTGEKLKSWMDRANLNLENKEFVTTPFKLFPKSFVKKWLVIKYPVENSGSIVTGLSINGRAQDAFVSKF